MNNHTFAILSSCMVGIGVVLGICGFGLTVDEDKGSRFDNVGKGMLFLGIALVIDGMITLFYDGGHGKEGDPGAAYWFCMAGVLLFWAILAVIEITPNEKRDSLGFSLGLVALTASVIVSFVFCVTLELKGSSERAAAQPKNVYHIVSSSGDEIAILEEDGISKISEKDGTVTVRLNSYFNQLTFENCQYILEQEVVENAD